MGHADQYPELTTDEGWCNHVWNDGWSAGHRCFRRVGHATDHVCICDQRKRVENTKAERDEGTVEGCEDCVMILANGEAGDWSEAQYEDWTQRVEAIWPNAEWHLAYACPEDCEGGFSMSPCGVCGSRLGGDRHPVAYRKR